MIPLLLIIIIIMKITIRYIIKTKTMVIITTIKTVSTGDKKNREKLMKKTKIVMRLLTKLN